MTSQMSNNIAYRFLPCHFWNLQIVVYNLNLIKIRLKGADTIAFTFSNYKKYYK